MEPFAFCGKEGIRPRRVGGLVGAKRMALVPEPEIEPRTGIRCPGGRQVEQALNCTFEPNGRRVACANAGKLSLRAFVRDNGDFPAVFHYERHVNAGFVAP